MATISLGVGGEVDLSTLIRTRLLIQANSGGGKSFTISRLVEQCFGKVQTIIIDPEGEFVSLREKYGFALLGKGGEISGEVRHAEFMAGKILELGAPVVCDLYEMKPHERPQWVKAFLTGLLNAPKELWHPVIVVVDEAHKFCPERGKGEAESTEAMLSLATTGRKRGFCAVFATQRLGKLNKDAAAELLNVLIGRTFLDVDRDRAAEILGIERKGRAEFDETLRGLTPGQFYALGPAISTKPELIRIGKVETSHPETGVGHIAAKTPPTPDEIKKLLPKLADLPRSAEEKARTEAELRTEIRSLKAQLAAKPKADADPQAVQKAVEAALIKQRREFDKEAVSLRDQFNALQRKVQSAVKTLGGAVEIAPLPRPVLSQPTLAPTVKRVTEAVRQVSNGNGHLDKATRSILAVLAQHDGRATKNKIAVIAGYAVSGGGFNNALSKCRSNGWVAGSDPLEVTEAGLCALGPIPPLPDGEELLAHWNAQLGKAEREIIRVLRESTEQRLSKEEIAARTDKGNGDPYDAEGGGFNNAISRLRTLELISGPGTGLQICEELA